MGSEGCWAAVLGSGADRRGSGPGSQAGGLLKLQVKNCCDGWNVLRWAGAGWRGPAPGLKPSHILGYNINRFKGVNIFHFFRVHYQSVTHDTV